MNVVNSAIIFKNIAYISILIPFITYASITKYAFYNRLGKQLHLLPNTLFNLNLFYKCL